MTYKRFLHVLFVMLLFSNLALSQTPPKEKETIRKKRLNKVEFYHIGLGLEAGINHNFVIGPMVYAGIGSFRNFFNADAGVKLLWTNPAGSSTKERISHLQLPVFAALSLNLIRWKHGSAYLGAEFDYHLFLNAKHNLPGNGGKISDKELSHNYASTSVRLGVRLNRWDIQSFYEWDLSPSFNQKYVYESQNYNYDVLYNALFSRTRFGLKIAYIIPL